MRRLLRAAVCAVWIGCLWLLAPCALAMEEAALDWTVRLAAEGTVAPARMALHPDGGAYIVGATDAVSGEMGEGRGGMDGFVVRVDGEGRVLWQKRLGGSGEDAFTHVLAAADGGCIAMGVSSSRNGDVRAPRGGTDAWIVRMDEAGKVLWTKNLGGTRDDELLFIAQGEDETLFVCGRTKSYNGDLGENHGGWDAWAMLLDGANGKPQWVERYGDKGDDVFFSALPASGGWLLLGEVGEVVSADEAGKPVYGGKPIAALYSATGEEVWHGGLFGDGGEARFVAARETEQGWLLLGEANARSALMLSTRGGADIWIVYLRQNGSVAWQRAYGGSGDDRPAALLTLPGGGFIALGTTTSRDGQVSGAHGGAEDLWLMRAGSLAGGVPEWQQAIGGSLRSIPAGLTQTKDGGFLVAGTTFARDGDMGRAGTEPVGFLARLASNGNLLWVRSVGGEGPFALLDIQSAGGAVYLLGSDREPAEDGVSESLWIGKLKEE